MSKLKYNVKFPCGYEISMEVTTSPSLVGSASGEFDEEKFKVCPLHGKNCPPKK